MAAKSEEGEWPHHQILRSHRQYAFRQHLRIQEAVPYLLSRKAIPKSLAEKIVQCPSQSSDDYNINFLLGYLRDARAERFVRFIEALGDSSATCKSHATLIDTMSEGLENISNADMDQVRRVRAVVKIVGGGHTSKTEEDLLGGSNSLVPSTITTDSVVSEGETNYQSNTVTTQTESKEKAPVMKTETIPKTEVALFQPMKGFIRPGIIKFFKRDALTENQKSWIFYDSTHGIKIDIPVSAVPPEILHFTVIAHAYLNGNFRIPEEFEVCTAIFTLRTKPNFYFMEPVSLMLPHSAIVEEDEDDEDLVVLRAKDPKLKTEEYDFGSDIISSAQYSEDYYYIEVDLDHFSAVAGAKRKSKYRSTRRRVPRRKQNSTSKERRDNRITRKKRLKNIKKQSGDSVGSSLHSSYEASFERDTIRQDPNLLLTQGSSAEQGIAAQRSLLQRQGAIDDISTDAPIPLVHQASGGGEPDAASCNGVYIAYCCPTKCLTSWTNRFFVVPIQPTGKTALNHSKKAYKEKCQLDIECVVRTAIPTSRIICFYPEGWESDGWIVQASSTPQIPLDIVQDPSWSEQPQFVDFEAESKNRESSTKLKHVIRVSGVEPEVFFTIQSTKKSITRQRSQIHIKTWVYTEDSQVLPVLRELARGSEEINTALCPDHMSTNVADERRFNADICTLMAEIAFQIADDELFFEHLPISNREKERLHEEEKDMTECMYRALFVWIQEKRPHLLELKEFLQTVGFENFVLSDSEEPTHNVEQLDDRPCERMLCTHLANKLTHKRWKFVGRYLGLGKTDIDELEWTAREEGLTEAIYKMLEKWCQQFGNEATVISLLKAVVRVNQLGLCMEDAVCYLERELIL